MLNEQFVTNALSLVRTYLSIELDEWPQQYLINTRKIMLLRSMRAFVVMMHCMFFTDS